MRRASADKLSFVTECTKEKLDLMKAGCAFKEQTGYSIEELAGLAVVHRLELAREILRSATACLSAEPPCYRAAISRSYYAMYHSIRAVVFYTTGGDDHERHSRLPGHLPDDFPERATWENDIKGARLERNRADYEPYPRQDRALADRAYLQNRQAKQLVRLTRAYLRTKGCYV